MKSSQQNFPHYNNKGVSYIASILSFASVIASASAANAATFSFSFSNQTGSVPGTVEGIIELPEGDGIFAATSVVVTSAPTQVLPSNGTDFVPNAELNSFEVLNGTIIVDSSLNFLSQTNDFTLDFFGDDFAILTNEITSDNVQSNITSVSFNPVVSTPEPTSIMTLLGVGVLGVMSKLQNKHSKSAI